MATKPRTAARTSKPGSPRRGSVSSERQASFTAPGLSQGDGQQVAEALQARLCSLVDLGLTLKHIHWNVVGPSFIGVHEMLDPQYAGVSAMVDALAERVATMGGVPSGLPGRIVSTRTWDDYDLGRADTQAHLAALDIVYSGVIASHRDAIESGRQDRSRLGGSAHRADRRARAVPLVRPLAPRGLRRRTRQCRRDQRERRCSCRGDEAAA